MASLFKRRKLLVVLVLVALIVAGGNQLSATLRLDYYTKRTGNIFAYQKSGQRADLILLGSSQTREGIIANQLVELLAADGLPGIDAFNLSQPGAIMLTTRIALSDLVESNGCPALVAVEVSPASLNQGRRWEDVAIGGAGLAELQILLPEFSSAERLNRFMAFQLHGLDRLFYRLVNPPSAELVERDFRRRGSIHRREPPTTRPRKVLSVAWVIRGRDGYRRTHWANFAIGSLQIRALQETLSLAAGCSAEVLLVRMPNLVMHDPHDIEGIETVYATFMESFVAENDLRYADLQWADLGLGREHFRNVNHLNAFGAGIVTRHLTTEWLAPILHQR